MGEKEAVAERRPVLVLRGGRGKSGGSFALSHAIQRARHQGRKVRVLDADRRSETLFRTFGPPAEWDPAKEPRDPEWAVLAPSEEPTKVRDWIMDDLDRMATDRMSRVVDFNGGDRVISEVQGDLNLGPFCDAVGIDMLALITLGPEIEDFRHMVRAVEAGHVQPRQVLLVLNGAFVSQGTTVEDAFAEIRSDPSFRKVVQDGARPVFMRRLPCVAKLREMGLGAYRAAYPAEGEPVRSHTVQHMAIQWIEDYEAKLAAVGADRRLP